MASKHWNRASAGGSLRVGTWVQTVGAFEIAGTVPSLARPLPAAPGRVPRLTYSDDYARALI